MDYDISILSLKSPLPLSKSIQPVALPTLNQEVPEGEISVVTGWGALHEGGVLPVELQEVQVPIVGNEQCQKIYALYSITDRMLCAGYLGEGGKDSCQVGEFSITYYNCFNRRFEFSTIISEITKFTYSEL